MARFLSILLFVPLFSLFAQSDLSYFFQNPHYFFQTSIIRDNCEDAKNVATTLMENYCDAYDIPDCREQNHREQLAQGQRGLQCLVTVIMDSSLKSKPFSSFVGRLDSIYRRLKVEGFVNRFILDAIKNLHQEMMQSTRDITRMESRSTCDDALLDVAAISEDTCDSNNFRFCRYKSHHIIRERRNGFGGPSCDVRVITESHPGPEKFEAIISDLEYIRDGLVDEGTVSRSSIERVNLLIRDMGMDLFLFSGRYGGSSR